MPTCQNYEYEMQGRMKFCPESGLDNFSFKFYLNPVPSFSLIEVTAALRGML